MSYPDVDDGVSSKTLQRVEFQVPLKVTSIKARDGQAVPVTSLEQRKKKKKLISKLNTKLNLGRHVSADLSGVNQPGVDVSSESSGLKLKIRIIQSTYDWSYHTMKLVETGKAGGVCLLFCHFDTLREKEGWFYYWSTCEGRFHADWTGELERAQKSPENSAGQRTRCQQQLPQHNGSSPTVRFASESSKLGEMIQKYLSGNSHKMNWSNSLRCSEKELQCLLYFLL